MKQYAIDYVTCDQLVVNYSCTSFIYYKILMDQDIKNERAEKPVVLYVDDEVNNLTSFKAAFRRDFKIITAENAVEGRKILDAQTVNIIITDQRMPGMTGVEFLESIRHIYPDPIRILLTGYSDISAVIDAINRGEVYRYVTKPWYEHELKMTLDNALEVFGLRAENKILLDKLLKANEQLEFLLRQQLLS